MKSSITVLFCFISTISISQNYALKKDVKEINSKVYYEAKPYTGELYEYNENVKNDCSCTLKAIYSKGVKDGVFEEWYVNGNMRTKALYSNGKRNGLFESWYSNGQKKYFGNFNLDEKNGSHIEWNENGTKNKEKVFYSGKLSEEKEFYDNGNLKVLKRYNIKNNNLKYIKQLYDNKTVKIEAKYKNGKLDGKFSSKYTNGNTHRTILYDNGKIIKKTIYAENGELEESLLKSNTPKILEFKKFENGNLIIKGYYNDKKIKENTWTYFDNSSNKIQEITYNSGKIISRGKFKNNEKDGLWIVYKPDGITQTNTIYEDGVVKSSNTFKTSQLYLNHFDKTDNVNLYEYKDEKGNKQNITLSLGKKTNPSSLDNTVISKINEVFNDYFIKIPKSAVGESTIINKNIFVSNVKLKFKKTMYVDKYSDNKKTITGYDAFIFFDLTMKDTENKKLYHKSYKANKSDKLLNSLLNNVAQSYARNKKDALISALKGINFKKFFKRNFPKK